MELYQRTLEGLKDRRTNILEGGINSIPTSFTRFSDDFLGVEQGTYYCVTSTTKGGKSQFASYTFIYNPIIYAFYNRDKVKVKVFYFILEETPERVMQRFMSYILFHISKGKVRVSPKDLRSSKNDRPVDEEVLLLLESPQYAELFNFFQDSIIFSTTANPTGIYKECKAYAEEHGKVTTKKAVYKGELGELNETTAFDHYIPNDPKEYKIVFIDHIGLVDTERGMSLKQSMDKLSEYLSKYLRNRYGFSPVVIQQQSFGNESNDNFVSGKIRPSVQGLGDSKYIGRDCNILLGLFSPFKFELEEYKGYDITKFRDNIRFLEVLVNRDGEMGGLCALFFDGAVCDFNELPLPSDKNNIARVYSYIQSLRMSEGKSTFFSFTEGKYRNLNNLHRWNKKSIFAFLKKI